MPIEFIIFVLILIGVALFHKRAFEIAFAGCCALFAYKLGFTEFEFWLHLHHERLVLINLLGLLLGFAVLSEHFTGTRLPEIIPRWLPDDWKGGLYLLVLVFVLSAFLDNIAAALIGATIAGAVYNKKVHLGFLVALIAASNAGGAGSVLGDTTTTMMWVDGVPATSVLEATVGSFVALLFFAGLAARQQHNYQPIQKDAALGVEIDWIYMGMVLVTLVLTILANVVLDFPALGLWCAIILGSAVRPLPVAAVRSAFKGALFLLSLVLAASLMPVEHLPKASWWSTLLLGFVSAIFDNIPLTKLALDQGGYDWGFVAYAVGYGGSMVWFGSSAGVAVSNIFPQAKSVLGWIREGWFVTVAYVLGFFAMLIIVGWHPDAPHKRGQIDARAQIRPEVGIILERLDSR